MERSMTKSRKKFDAAFKAKIALEALPGFDSEFLLVQSSRNLKIIREG
jgi:hypothetical protein